MACIYFAINISILDYFLGWNFAAAMSEWGIFFKLGIPGILMIGFEEWCLELSTFIAG